MEKTTHLESSENLNAKNSDFFLFDTHCHLSDESYSKEEVLEILENQFFRNNNNRVLNVGGDFKSNKRLISQSQEFPPNIHYAIGFHPNSAYELNDRNMIWLDNQAFENKIVAIGEIGLDYYRNFTEKEDQKIFFKKQVIIAKKHGLPVILHLRDKGDNLAFFDALSILKEVEWRSGVVHCFSSKLEVAREFIDLGFYISFSGTITFNNNRGIDKVICGVPIERILVETDSPYLSPSPLRGKKNYPWNVFYNIEFISKLRKIDIFDLSSKIFLNSLEFLSLKIN